MNPRTPLAVLHFFCLLMTLNVFGNKTLAITIFSITITKMLYLFLFSGFMKFKISLLIQISE